MANRGVYSPPFIQALTLFLGVLKNVITEILVNDYQSTRLSNHYYVDNYSLGKRQRIQTIITNKLLKTFEEFIKN